MHLCRPYRHYPVCVPPPPSSGVSLLADAGMLDHTDIASRGPTTRRPGSCSHRRAASCTPTATVTSQIRTSSRYRWSGCSIRPTCAARAADRRARRACRTRKVFPCRAGATPAGVARHQPLRRRRRRRRPRVDDHHVETVFGSGRTVGGFVLNNQLTISPSAPEDGRPAGANACRAASARAPRWRRSSCSITPTTSCRARLPGRLGDPRVQRQGDRDCSPGRSR